MNEAVTSWPLRVEMDVLHQHLAGALRDAAVDLAVQQQRIEHGADVVDHAVAHDLDLAGFLVDLDFADVAAVRIILHRALCRRRWRRGRAPWPAGILAGLAASMATSLMVMVRLVFGDENTPSAKLTSAASTLSACAAIALAFSITLSVAIVEGRARPWSTSASRRCLRRRTPGRCRPARSAPRPDRGRAGRRPAA